MVKQKPIKKYVFADGYTTWVLNFSAAELRREETKHGKCMSVTKG